jgi:phosphonate transport system substrate-binding protein
MFKSFSWARLPLTLLMIPFLNACTHRAEIGTKSNPIKIYLVPGQDAKVLQDNGELMRKYFQNVLQLEVEVRVPTSYIAIVEAFGSKRVDIALMNPFGYILAHDKYGAIAKLRGVYKGRSEYRSQILVKKDSPFQKVEDLQGKTFSFVDPTSTSGYLLPAKIFKEKKITFKETVFAGKHDTSVTMLYQGKVDAAATYYAPDDEGIPQDARKLVKKQFPDVFEKTRILLITDPIPSEPVVFRKDLPAELSEKLLKTMLDFSQTKEGAAVLETLYHTNGFRRTSDEDYAPIRAILKELGKSAEDLIQ